VLTGAPEPGLYLVRDANPAVFPDYRVRLAEVIWRALSDSADALDRLGDERGNFAGRRIANQLSDVRGALGSDFLGGPAQWTDGGIGRQRMVHPRMPPHRMLPGVMGGQTNRAGRAAVVRVSERDNVGVPGE
jgi:hypothetical protein